MADTCLTEKYFDILRKKIAIVGRIVKFENLRKMFLVQENSVLISFRFDTDNTSCRYGYLWIYLWV
jgi:hypothetical protein